MDHSRRVRQMVRVGIGVKRVSLLPINLKVVRFYSAASRRHTHGKILVRWRSRLASTPLVWRMVFRLSCDIESERGDPACLIRDPSPHARDLYPLGEDCLADGGAWGNLCGRRLLQKPEERTDEAIASDDHNFLQHAHSEPRD